MQTTETISFSSIDSKKRVLNVGSGAYTPERLHPVFRNPAWQEVRLDIDPATAPDIVGTLTDLGNLPSASFDAIWSSHSIEHLHKHEVAPAVLGFFRLLKADGFALITCPDIEAVAQKIVEGHIDDVAYQSPAGPITPLDMVFGHAASIERGQGYMAHNTAFTEDRLARVLLEGGFEEVMVTKGPYELWALAVKDSSSSEKLKREFKACGLNFYEAG